MSMPTRSQEAMVRPGFFFVHALPHDPQDAHTRATLSDVCKLPISMCRIQFGVLAPNGKDVANQRALRLLAHLLSAALLLFSEEYVI
jgi:hypothetical protein